MLRDFFNSAFHFSSPKNSADSALHDKLRYLRDAVKYNAHADENKKDRKDTPYS